MKLEFRTNNAYDTVLLVGDDGKVHSDWTVDRQTMIDFCDLSQHPDDWDDRGGCEHFPDDYGILVATRFSHVIRVADESLWNEHVEFHVRRECAVGEMPCRGRRLPA